MYVSSQNIAILASAKVWIFLIPWVIYFSGMQVHAAKEGNKPLISMNGRNLSEKELKFEEHARRELLPGRSSFISIDCGIENGNDYTDSETGIIYTSDMQYIERGVNVKISDEFLSETQNYRKLLSTVRSFPEGNSNCYTLKPATSGGGNKYLIRAFFMYGNYDSKSQPPVFKLHLNANEWDEVKLDNASQILIKEIIHNPPTDYIHVCLVYVGTGTPFISALEIRELNNTIYETNGNDSLILYRRLDEGASSTTSNKFQRYTDDFYDRIWEVPDYRPDWKPIAATSYSSEDFQDNDFKPSPVAMSTAVTPVQGSSLVLSQNVDRNQQFYLYMHFLELQDLPSNATREFEINVNNVLWWDPVSPSSSYPCTRYTSGSVGSAGSLIISISMTEDSTLPPILNAVEYYTSKRFPILPTNQSDVEAMISIKSKYGVNKNWQGDPCVPVELRWDGLDCNTNDQGLYRIISMNLSFSGLKDEITSSFSKLDSLQSLDLSHNSLTGTIPEFLANMPSLTAINLSGNKLEGSVPAPLLDKMNNSRTLVLSLDGNPDLCLSGPCKKKKAHTQRLTVVVVVVSIISCLVVVVMGVVIFKRRKKATSTKGTRDRDEPRKEQRLGGTIVEPKKEQLLKPKGTTFKCSEIIEITNTFRTVIGRGGSGAVYLGHLEDGGNVAVKMLSSSSATCGQKQFLSEVEILIKIHHTNLVSFVGYCAEGTTRALICEHMANGNLRQYLSENNLNPLSWKQRVQIAFDAAQGLEYLHNGCKPPIIHRDLKSANILLNQKLQAKLADFGLSRIFASESDTHVTTAVAGTAGYLDPEYNNTFKFNEKSDVYSLGIVLLELITGKPAIIKGTDGVNIHIVEWVNKRVERGDIHAIMDPKLQGKFNINSAWKFLEAAMTCTMTMAIQRMSAMELLVELKQCLATEMAEEIASGTPGLSQDDCLEIDSVPSAR